MPNSILRPADAVLPNSGKAARTSDDARRDPAVLLKSTPPRAVRHFLDRGRLQLKQLEMSGIHATVLLAPVGFGKTTQLANWQRQALARGMMTIWYSLDARDEPDFLVRGLAHSARSTCGKRAFDNSFMNWMDGRADPIDAATGLLAEIANLAEDVLLLLDDVDLLPTSTRTQVLTYLLGNAPANLHIAMAARPTGALLATGALSLTPVNRVTASEMRFRYDETRAVLAAALSAQRGLEAGGRLHELTEGWPLGIQLAVAALQRSGDLEGLLGAATADIQRYFVDTAIDRQSSDSKHMLIRLAHFDVFHPDLCEAVLGTGQVRSELLRLEEETPLLQRHEGSDWMHLQPLAREALREHLALLPYAERQVISRRASDWFARNGHDEEAAQHAFLAGDVDAAILLVERDSFRMTVLGRSDAVLTWFQRLSPEDVNSHPGFWAPVAWALAMSERHAEAQPLIDRILERPDLTDLLRFEADLIAATAAAFADRVDVEARIHARWPQPPNTARPGDAVVWRLSCAFADIYSGHPDKARLQWSRCAVSEKSEEFSPVASGFADFGTGLSYLWEGRYALAEEILGPALARAEHRLARQNPVTCILASLLAEACLELGRTEESRTLLAGRLKTIEEYGHPAALISAYRTLARIADQEGRQDQSLSLLDALCAMGEKRAMLRLQVAAKCEMTRLHARHGRAETAQLLSSQLDTLLRDSRHQWPAPLAPWLDLHGHLARAYSSLAVDGQAELAKAIRAADSVAHLAAQIKRDGDAMEAKFLRAEVLQRQGVDEAPRIRSEAISLAMASGARRLLLEQETRAEPRSSASATPASSAIEYPQPAASPSSSLRRSGLLTAKELEILLLLSRNLSNKEIALALTVSEQTVKWHIKNLFNKINAGSRKHAVARARLLRLID